MAFHLRRLFGSSLGEFMQGFYQRSMQGGFKALFKPQLMRWNGVDPMADYQTFESTYAYMGTDPINLVDPDGAQPRDPMDNGWNWEDDGWDGGWEFGVDVTADRIHPQWGYGGWLYANWATGSINTTWDPGLADRGEGTWGDAIRIIGRGRKDIAIYRDGKLYNLDGTSPYNGRSLRFNKRTGENALRGFMNAAVVAIVTASKNSVTASALFLALSNSPITFYILRGTTNRTGILPGTVNGDKNVYGVQWNPYLDVGGTDVNGSRVRDPWLGLVHELARVYTGVHGLADYSLWYRNGERDVPNDDKWATHLENQVRYESGIPLRKYYGLDTGIPTGQVIFNNTNVSIYVIDYNTTIPGYYFDWDPYPNFTYGISLFVFPKNNF